MGTGKQPEITTIGKKNKEEEEQRPLKDTSLQKNINKNIGNRGSEGAAEKGQTISKDSTEIE